MTPAEGMGRERREILQAPQPTPAEGTNREHRRIPPAPQPAPRLPGEAWIGPLLRGGAAALLFAGFALPGAGSLVAFGLVALAGAAFLRRGAAVREIPPALLAAWIGLLAAFAYAQTTGGATALDRPALLVATLPLAAFAPFYLADHLPPFPPLFLAALAAAFCRHFELAARHFAGSAAPLPLAGPDGAFLAGSALLPLLLVLAIPALESLGPTIPRIVFEGAWFFLAAFVVFPFHPAAAAALVLALAVALLVDRTAHAAFRLAAFLGFALVALVLLHPGATLADKTAALLAPERAGRATALAALAALPEPAGLAEGAGPGLPALRRQLAARQPDGHFDADRFHRLPALLLLALGPGVPFALLLLLFHLVLINRLRLSLKRLPRGTPARTAVTSMLAAANALVLLLFFTGETALTGAAAPVFFALGAGVALTARHTDPLPRPPRPVVP